MYQNLVDMRNFRFNAVFARRETELCAAITNITFDVSAGTVGGTLGSKAFGLLGLMVFGPAGGIIGGIAGSFIGYRKGRGISSFLKYNLFCKSKEYCIEESLKNFMKSTANGIENSLVILERKTESFDKSLKNRGPIKSTLMGTI
jgi:hypothetical protein